MTLTFEAGLAQIRIMQAHRVNIGANNCKLRTREAFDVPSSGAPSAAASWYAAPDKHTDRNPSRAPAFSFGWMTGGGKGSGHVVVNLGNGRILTPGGPADDSHWYETTAAELLRRWTNLRWVGWTRSIDGKFPTLPIEHATKPTPPAHATLLQRAIYHEDNPYAKGNSPEGDAIAAGRHLWADRDLQRCLAGSPLKPRNRITFINTHWSKPSVERFALPGGRVPRRPFRLMRWSRVKTLTTKAGRTIRTAHRALLDAKKAGIPGTELELKFVPSQAALDRLAATSRSVYGEQWADHVEIKAGPWVRRWKTALKRAKRAGFKTTAIRFEGDPNTLPHYVDHYRR